MCEESKSRPWYYRYPEHRAPVGYIDKEHNYILLSEGDDSSGCYYDIWVPTEKDKQDGPLYIIDTITKKNGIWEYNRQYGCDNLECAVATFMNLINPDFKT